MRLTGPWLESHNPSRPNEVVAKVQSAAVSDLDHIIEQAVKQWATWRRTRRKHDLQYYGRLRPNTRRRYELAAWEIAEIGKPWREADADVTEAVDFLRTMPMRWTAWLLRCD